MAGDVIYSSNADRGKGFARLALALATSQGDLPSAVGYAAAQFGERSGITTVLRSAMVAGTTTNSTWAAPLADTTLSDEFLAFARGKSVVEQLAPAMRNVQFNTRVAIETDESIVASWVGEGSGKPLSFGAFDTVQLSPYKVQGSVVVTRELLRSSTADVALRAILAAALSKAQDQAFLSADAASASQPAGILDGIAGTPSTGNAASDLAALFAAFAGDLSSAYLIAHPSAAAAIGMQNSLLDIGARGGSFAGVPLLVSKHVAGDSAGSALVLLDASQVVYAAGPVEVGQPALHASVEMSDAPVGNSATGTGSSLVSLFQSNSAAIRCERFISWQVARPEAVAWVSGVDYAAST